MTDFIQQNSDEGHVAATKPYPDDQGWRLVMEEIHPRDRARFMLPAQTRKLVDALTRMANFHPSLNVEHELSVTRLLLATLEEETDA